MFIPRRPRPGKRLLVALLAALGVAISATRARADFLNSFSGNTQTTNGTGLDGTYNFAVLSQASGGIAGNEWGAVINPRASGNAKYDPIFDSRFVAGTGSGSLDKGAQYLYLFQIVNNGTGSFPISEIATLVGNANAITSWGYFGSPGHQVGGNDNQGAVGLTNDFGTDGSHFDGKAYTGVTRPSIVNVSGSSVSPVNVSVVGGNLITDFPTGELASGNRSVLVGFTSNVAPTIHTGANQPGFTFRDGVFTASGQAPLPMPEPSALILLGIGVACVSVFYLRKRRALTPAVA